jgi:hypothetical protein
VHTWQKFFSAKCARMQCRHLGSAKVATQHASRVKLQKKYSLSFHHKRGARSWPPLVRCVPVVPFCPYIKGMVSTSITACPPFTSTANTSSQMSRVQVVQCGNVASLNLLQTPSTFAIVAQQMKGLPSRQ